MTIGQLARAANVQPSRVRYYERRGVLPAPLRAGGARRYDERDLARLQTILVARRLGISLSELRAAATGATPLRDIAAARASQLDETIRRARVMRALLRHAAKYERLATNRYARLLSLIGA